MTDLEIKTLQADLKSMKVAVVVATIAMIVFVIFCFIAVDQRDGWMNNYKSLKQQATELNYAGYNRTNGCWQWNTNQ